MAKILIVSGIFVTALTVLVWVGIVEASIPVLKLSQLRSAEYEGGTIRLDEGQVAQIDSLAPLRFTIATKNDPSSTLQVESDAPPPENLKVGIDVGLLGEYNREKQSFRASKVSTRCPSRYQASEDAGGVGVNGYPPSKAEKEDVKS